MVYHFKPCINKYNIAEQLSNLQRDENAYYLKYHVLVHNF